MKRPRPPGTGGNLGRGGGQHRPAERARVVEERRRHLALAVAVRQSERLAQHRLGGPAAERARASEADDARRDAAPRRPPTRASPGPRYQGVPLLSHGDRAKAGRARRRTAWSKNRLERVTAGRAPLGGRRVAYACRTASHTRLWRFNGDLRRPTAGGAGEQGRPSDWRYTRWSPRVMFKGWAGGRKIEEPWDLRERLGSTDLACVRAKSMR